MSEDTHAPTAERKTPRLVPRERTDVMYPDVRSYDVYLGAELIGRVESHRTSSWRKHGRIRVGKIGDPKHWTATDTRRQSVGWRFNTRQDAVRALVATTAETFPLPADLASCDPPTGGDT